MTKLFRKDIPDEVVDKLCRALGFTGLNDGKELRHRNYDKVLLEEALSLIWPYYVPCHAKRFLRSEPSFVEAITILRQVMRARGRTLIVRERKPGGISRTSYQLDKSLVEVSQETSFSITFD